MLPIFSGRFGGGLSFFNHPLSKNTTGSLSNIFQSAERDVSRGSKNDELSKQSNISQSQLSLARRESRDSMFALSRFGGQICDHSSLFRGVVPKSYRPEGRRTPY